MSSIINIQLRQQDAINVTANGEYECQLSKDVTIEAGDVVQLSKAFIDTVKEGNINIIDDLTLTIQSGIYFNNWMTLAEGEGAPSFINYQGEVVPVVGTAPCFKRFIPYLPVDSGSLSNYTNYTYYQYNIDTSIGIDFNAITYSYIDFSGSLQHIHTLIDPISGRTKETYNDTLNIIALNGSVKIVSPSLSSLTQQGITPVGAFGSAIESKIYNPFIFTTTVHLPKGIYSPTQLSTYISEQLSNANSASATTQEMSASRFLFAITDFDLGRDNPTGQTNPNPPYNPITLAEQTTFISDDGELSYQFPINNTNLIGTSQVALEYDQTTDKFNFTYLHQPMLDATNGTNMCVRFLRTGLNTNGSVVGVCENGGIYFNSLTAKNSSGIYVDFWESIMGFNLDKLCVGFQGGVLGKYDLEGIVNLSEPLVTGVNITTGYYGLDASVIRGATSWYSRQPVPNTQAGICSTINNTININAENTLDELLNKFSHYVLQTDLGFYNNNYIGAKWYRNINAIISKYYAYQSYAFAESDAGIQYVHSGAPIQLKSVNIRILKSDITRDVNLGEDNTIILQVIKGGAMLPKLDTPKRA